MSNRFASTSAVYGLRPRVAAIVPAYNEAARVKSVLEVVRACPLVDQVVVVNDGSTDDTANRVLEVPGVYLLSLPRNVGKGGAMAAGARFTDADILLFLDADLIGLKTEHVHSLLEPVISGRARMSVGRFTCGRYLTDLSQRIAPSVSGQRAIHRSVFDAIPGVENARYGVEMLITRFCRYYRVETVAIPLSGVTHPMKEEKLGLLRGWASRSRMYGQILRILLDPRAPAQRDGHRRILGPGTVPWSFTGTAHGMDGKARLQRVPRWVRRLPRRPR